MQKETERNRHRNNNYLHSRTMISRGIVIPEKSLKVNSIL